MGSKLRKTIGERCPECGFPLQIRSRSVKRIEKGLIFYVDEEYIACSNKYCLYEKDTYKPNVRKRYFGE